MTTPDYKLEPTEPEVPRSTYQKHYWQHYKSKHRQVVGVLTHAEYEAIERFAKQYNRGVWAQIWLESCAYRNQQSVAIPAIDAQLQSVKIEMRRIGGHINQLKKMSELPTEQDVLNHLKQLEQTLEQSIQSIQRLQ